MQFISHIPDILLSYFFNNSKHRVVFRGELLVRIIVVHCIAGGVAGSPSCSELALCNNFTFKSVIFHTSVKQMSCTGTAVVSVYAVPLFVFLKSIHFNFLKAGLLLA